MCTQPFYEWPTTCDVCLEGRIDVGGSCDFCHDVTFCLRGGNHEVLADGEACVGGVVIAGDESFFSSKNATYCQRCDSGQYYSLSGTGVALNKLTTCNDCPAGFSNQNLASSCIPCAAGTYSSAVKSTQCALCAPGTFQDTVQATSCKDCAVGKFTASLSASACDECISGLYQDQAGQSACKTCSDGQATTTAGASSADECTEVNECPAGNFRRASGTGGCVGDACCAFCPPGKTTPGTGSYREDQCETCPAGWSSSGERSAALGIGTSNCVECVAGFAASVTYNNEGGHTLADSGSNKFQLCRACVGGQYTLEPRQEACKVCPVGYYGNQTSINAEGCGACATGKTSPYPAPVAGADSCVDPVCAAGQFYTTLDPLDCQDCPAGYSQNHRRANECVQCADGKISKEGFAQCEDAVCDAGQFYVALDPVNCQDCPGGYYQTYRRSNDCLLCPVGFYQLDSKSTACKDCIPGFYADDLNSTACAVCPEGYYSANANSVACTACPAGYYQNHRRYDQCFLCPKGFYQGDSKSAACAACPAGYYEQNTNSEACTACPAGYFQANTNSEACADCLAGYYEANINSTACAACPKGYFQASINSEACTGCPQATTQQTRTSAMCTACPKGYFQDSTNSEACTACPAGYFQASINSEACTGCLAGYYAANTNSEACTACPAGYFQASINSDAPHGVPCRVLRGKHQERSVHSLSRGVGGDYGRIYRLRGDDYSRVREFLFALAVQFYSTQFIYILFTILFLFNS